MSHPLNPTTDKQRRRVQIVEDVIAGVPYSAIVEKTGLRRATVISYAAAARKAGVRVPYPPRERQLFAEVVRAALERTPYKTIAEQVGLDRKTVRQYLYSARREGTSIPPAKWSAHDKTVENAKLIQLHRSGSKTREIAAAMGWSLSKAGTRIWRMQIAGVLPKRNSQ